MDLRYYIHNKYIEVKNIVVQMKNHLNNGKMHYKHIISNESKTSSGEISTKYSVLERIG